MTPTEVLARELFATARYASDPAWDDMPGDLQQSWLDRADVIAARMDEVRAEEVTGIGATDLPDLTLPQHVELLAASAELTSEHAVAAQLETLEETDALQALGLLRHATWLAGTVDAALVRHLYLTSEHGERLIDGVGKVRVYRSRSSERWDERGVARAVIDAKMEERGGELPDDPGEVAEWLLEAVSVGYARKTVLRGMGIPLEPFYDSLPGKPKVDLPRVT